MKRFFAGCGLAFALVFTTTLPAYADTAAESRQQIELVVEAFRNGIITKDQDRFMTLFLRDDITWASALDDASLDRIMARRTDKSLPRPKKTFQGTPREFIEGLAKAKESFDETFDHLRIDTDGDVAQVWFDYSFKVGGLAQNSGKEAWQLVRTEDGWKIASVIWSTKLHPEPPTGAGAK